MLRATLAVIAPLSARTRPICPSFTCCRPCHRLRSRLFSRGRRPSFLSFCVLRLLAGPYFVPRSKAPLGGSVLTLHHTHSLPLYHHSFLPPHPLPPPQAHPPLLSSRPLVITPPNPSVEPRVRPYAAFLCCGSFLVFSIKQEKSII